MGFIPHRAAKAGSDLSRSGLPAGSNEKRGCGVRSDSEGLDQCRRSLRGEPDQLLVDTFDLGGELAVTVGK
jgi:hypothetical protein